MKIPHIYKSNVAGVNLYGIGISVNQEIAENDKGEIDRSPKIFVTGMIKGKTLFWLITSSLLSVGSISFCAACLPRIICEERPGFDYMGVIVGILALFITFLVAWQISQTMASREEIRKAEIAARKVSELQNELQLLKDVPDGYLFYALAIVKLEEEKYYDAFDFYYYAIRSFIRGNVDYAKYTTVALDAMSDCIESAERKGSELEKFKRCSLLVSKILTDLEHDIENVNRLADEARRKVQRIRAVAQQYGILN